MKIVAIMGSPHKGNSLQKTQRIEALLTEHDDVEFEYIHLKDVDLKPCRGCFSCFIRGEASCPLRDDGPEIARTLDEADGVIFVTPVYSMHVSYLMKRFIDRFGYNFHRPRYWGKYALVVAVTGNLGLKETLKYQEDVAKAWGFDLVDRLGYLAAPQHTPMRTISNRPDHTEEVVERFYAAIKAQQPRKLTFTDHLAFRIMQASYRRLDTMSPTDFQYWEGKGWLGDQANYFHGNVRRSAIMDGIARFVGWMTGRQIDKALKST